MSGLVAAVFGLIDFLAIPKGTRAKRIGALHGIGNVVVVVLFRGELVDRLGVGVDDGAHLDAPRSLRGPVPSGGAAKPERAPELVRVRPRPHATHIGRGRSVLATTAAGLIDGDPDQGLFVHETRVISRWRYLVDGREPRANAFSPVRQNHWTGYFVIDAPGVEPPPRDDGSGQVPSESRIPLELRITRVTATGCTRTST